MMFAKMELVLTTLILACLQSSVLPDAQGEALYELKMALNAAPDQLKDWSPSQVSPCTWSHIICDSNNNVISVVLSIIGSLGVLSPKIGTLTALSTLTLQGNGITGRIPEELGNLLNLTKLHLQNNTLIGEIPSSLGNLKKLQFLVLTQNNLSGMIPESLATLPNLIDLQLASNNLSGEVPQELFQISHYDFTGNKLNCGVHYPRPCRSVVTNDSGGPQKPNITIIVGISGGLVFLSGCLLFYLCKRRHKFYNREAFVDVAGDYDHRIDFGQLKRFAWTELKLATDNFCEKNVLGKGGFGKVYKGILPDNTKIAVKRLTDYKKPGGDATFQREVEMISVAVHRNLLKLIGFCTTPTERLLVYPFMQNLSVAYRLRELRPGEPVLDWSTRKRVALGTARGLEYLHEHCNPKIIHRDVKAANVLLDEDFEPVVRDFGLAKIVDVKDNNVTTQVRGTLGHIAPEYLATGKPSERTDIYSYGIMLLELVTGQRAIDFARPEGEENLALLEHLQKENKLDEIVDRNLDKNYKMEEVEMVAQIALLCTQSPAEDRPSMSEVVRMLEGEGLAERWEEWLNLEFTQRQEYERRLKWGDDSVYLQNAIELSGGR